MTEQSKIPLPRKGDTSQASGTLIERAVDAFDWRRLNPPPVPQILPAPPLKRGGDRRSRKFALVAEADSISTLDALPVQPAHEDVAVAFPPKARRRKEVRFDGEKHAVDRALLRDLGMIVPETGVSRLLEEFRIVKRQILANAAELRGVSGEGIAQRVLVCSPLPGEGKTFCSVNLALAMAAEKESEVLLVDADFAKPSVLATLGLPAGPGLMDALADPAIDVADCVMGTDIPGLWVLPAGNATNTDSEFLSSARTVEVLDRLTGGAPNRMVIFDSPPALAASPAAELAKHVGQALVVARADSTGQGALEDAISLLSACPNIQLLLNSTSFSPSGRRFGTYYGYGS